MEYVGVELKMANWKLLSQELGVDYRSGRHGVVNVWTENLLGTLASF